MVPTIHSFHSRHQHGDIGYLNELVTAAGLSPPSLQGANFWKIGGLKISEIFLGYGASSCHAVSLAVIPKHLFNNGLTMACWISPLHALSLEVVWPKVILFGKTIPMIDNCWVALIFSTQMCQNVSPCERNQVNQIIKGKSQKKQHGFTIQFQDVRLFSSKLVPTHQLGRKQRAESLGCDHLQGCAQYSFTGNKGRHMMI